MAVDSEGTAVGCADLFDFDPYHRRAGVGVLIDSRLRNNGYGKAMLRELGQFAATHLQLHLLYCDIADNNIASIRLFESEGFQRCGISGVVRPEPDSLGVKGTPTRLQRVRL